jgi:hypothetical protein
MRDRLTTREQQCGLHLLDLCRAYPRDPATPQALALLEEYRVRGAELRRLAELQAAAERALVPGNLTAARRRLVRLIRARGGLVQPAKQRAASTTRCRTTPVRANRVPRPAMANRTGS